MRFSALLVSVAALAFACQPSPAGRGAQPSAHAGPERVSEEAAAAAAPIALAPLAPEAPPAVSAAPVLPVLPTRVLFVTIDGVRVDDVFDPVRGRGAFSCLRDRARAAGAALGGGGESCGRVEASGPSFVSLPGYLEIFSGRASSDCVTNDCPRTREPTFLDELRAVPKAGRVASVTSWNKIDRAATRSTDWAFMLAGAEASPRLERAPDPLLGHLLAEGRRAAGFPGTDPDYRPDAHTMRVAKHVLRQERPRFLHVGLGDADEYAHRGDVNGYFSALKASDAFVCEAADELASQGSPSLVVVTSDHGRFTGDMRHHGPGLPGSSRAFVAAFGTVLRPSGSCASRDVTLSDIAPTLRVHLGLPRDTSPRAGRPIEELLPAR